MTRRLGRFSGALALAVLALGCTDSDVDAVCEPEGGVSCGGGAVRRSTIDTGEGFDLDPGEGVGVFVEYAGDGEYRVTATCDSEFTGYSCYFDVLLSAAEGGELYDYEPEALDNDALGFVDDGVLSFRSITDYEADSFYVITDPGAVLAVDVLLDCGCGNPYLFWIGDGAIHGGSPSNPLELEPSEP